MRITTVLSFELHDYKDKIKSANTILVDKQRNIGPAPHSCGNLYQHGTCPIYGHCFNPGCIPLRSGGENEGGRGGEGRGKADVSIWGVRL